VVNCFDDAVAERFCPALNRDLIHDRA